MSFKWTPDQIEKLIICVEEHPPIYHIKSNEYLDRNKQMQAFYAILENLQETVNPGITLDEIKRKWKNLRTQYMQELISINQSKKVDLEWRIYTNQSFGASSN